MKMGQSKFLFTYLYYSSKYLCQNVFFVAFIIIFEYLSIFSSVIQATIYFKKYIGQNESNTTSKDSIFHPIYDKLSIIPIIKSQITCKSTSKPNINQCPMNFIPVFVLFSFFILLCIILFGLSRKITNTNIKKDKQSKLYSFNKLFLGFIFNFYDYFFFRISSIFSLFLFSNYLVNSVYHEMSYLLLIISIILNAIFLTVSCYYFKTIFIYAKFGFNYPFDLDSSNYDVFLLFLKLISGIRINLHFQQAIPDEFDNLIAFFSFLEVLIHLIYFFPHFIKFIANKNYILFPINSNFNFIRLFLLNYTSFCIIIFLIYYNKENYGIHLISHISMMLLAILSIKIFHNAKKRKIYNGSLINQLFYLIDKYPIIITNPNDKQSNQLTKKQIISFNELYINICMRHLIKCKSNSTYCKLCFNLNKQKKNNIITLKEIQKIFKILYSQIPSAKLNQDWKYHCLHFISKIITSNNNYFFVNSFICQTIFDFGKINKTIASNAFVFYRMKIKNLRQLMYKVNLLYSFRTQSNQITQLLDIVYNTFFLQVLNPYNIVTSSVNVSLLWKSIRKVLNVIDHKNQFQSIVFKYVLEKLFNKKQKMSDGIFDITFYDDILNDQYMNDKHMILNYDLVSHYITIISSGKEFIQYKNKRFEEIFLAEYAEEGVKKFKETLLVTKTRSSFETTPLASSIQDHSIDVNTNTFTFPIKDIENSRYIMSFEYKYMTLPMINFKECIIFGLYQIRKDNYIMTQLTSKTNNEIILNYSFPMIKELIIPVEIIEQLLINKYMISFNQVFHSHNQFNSELYSINYQEYLDRIKILLDIFASVQGYKLENEMNSNYEFVLATIDKFEKSQVKKKDITLKSKYEIITKEKDKSKIILYLFDKDINNATYINDENNYNNDFHKEQIDVSSYLLFETNKYASINNNTTSTFGGSSSLMEHSVSSGISSAKRNAINLTSELKMEFIQKRRQLRNFILFTYIILIFNIFLIILTVIFLALLVDSNSQFISMFNFFIIWGQLIRLFLNSTSNIFFNLCTARKEETSCYNNFKDYGSELLRKNNLSLTFSFQIYFFDELIVKEQSLRKFLDEVTIKIYSQNEPEIIKVVESKFNYRYISIGSDNVISVRQEKNTFLDAVNIYFNLINIIIETNDYLNLPLYIININGNKIEDINLDSINPDAPLTNAQITGYNIILNYPFYLAAFFDLNDIIHDILLSDIKSVKNIIIIFFTLLSTVHAILLFISLWFSSFFKITLDHQIEEINKTLESPILRIELQKKIRTLKTISLLYNEHPNQLIARLDRKDFESQKDKIQIANINNPSQNEIISIHNRRKMYYNSSYYTKIFNWSLKGLYSVFIMYFVYSITFFIVLLISFSDYSDFILIISQNVKIDTSTNAFIGLLQILIITNQTEDELGKYLNSNITFTDNKNKQDQSFSHILTKQIFEASFKVDNELDNPLLLQFTDIDCNTAYDIIQDGILLQTNQQNSKENYLSIIPGICSSFDFMKMRDQETFIKELVFRLTLLSNNIQHSYEYLYKINNSFELFEIYLIVLLIYRPLRTYGTITLFSKSIQALFVENNWIAYTYLAVNIILEFIIFVLIWKYIIKKYKTIHKSMNRLKLCLKV